MPTDQDLLGKLWPDRLPGPSPAFMRAFAVPAIDTAAQLKWLSLSAPLWEPLLT